MSIIKNIFTSEIKYIYNDMVKMGFYILERFNKDHLSWLINRMSRRHC